MHRFLEIVQEKAKKNPKRIIFPEGNEPRILKACEVILKEGFAKPILVGTKDQIAKQITEDKLNLNVDELEIYDPQDKELKEKTAKAFYELRKHKNISLEDALLAVEDFNYFGTMLLHLNYGDGLVTGTTYPTADSIRPALQIIKTKEKFHKVSGVFFMILEERLLLFADCAITIDPTPEDIANTAIDTAETAKKFGIKPKVALLSFSTFSSADHPYVDEVKEALEIVRDKRPDLIVDGEMQVDAALVREVAKKKCPKSQIQGDANVLIFPTLEAANIAYKLVERLAKAQAIGPILQGLKKPVNDLSRGCSYNDIVHITAFTVCECE
jgi:phosphate acetyltransferase